MGQGGGGAEQDQCIAAQVHLRKTAFYHGADFLLRHAFLKGSENGAEDVEGGVASEANQLLFVSGFDAAAADGDGIGGGVLACRRGLAEMVEESERREFLDADAAGAESAVGQNGCREFRRSEERRVG